MPGGSGLVQLARLPDLADGAFRAFVRFPAGWSRPAPGHYAVPEEVLLLEGDLELSGHAFRAGSYAWLPAGWLRSAMRTEGGCLAFAWFSRAPRWISGESPQAARTKAVILHKPHGTLYDGPEHHTRVIAGRQLERLAVESRVCETLDLRDWSWSFRLQPAAR